MLRFLAGMGATALLVLAGFFLFRGGSAPDPLLPDAPAAIPSARAAPQGGVAPPEAAPPEAPQRTREQKRFDRYDKDRDGRIAREEYLLSRRKAYAKLDRNGDGRLSFDEWAVRTTTKFADADRDRSASLDAAEFLTTAPKRRSRPARCACPPAKPNDDDAD